METTIVYWGYNNGKKMETTEDMAWLLCLSGVHVALPKDP